MALDQSALLELLDALKATDVDEQIRQAAMTIYQALIEAELSSVIGALPHRHPAGAAQRAPAQDCLNRGWGSGLTDPEAAGRVVLPVTGRRRRRVDQSLFAMIIEAYLHGTSTPARSTTWSRP
jgi:putative transposase